MSKEVREKELLNQTEASAEWLATCVSCHVEEDVLKIEETPVTKVTGVSEELKCCGMKKDELALAN